jgi:broad specificity phosphatase PhoE
MIRITIYRHGQTNWNLKGFTQGHTNVPLNLTGLGQAFTLAKQVDLKKCDLILSSDLSRAHQTARVATQKFNENIPFVISKNLREMSFGKYEGKHSSIFIKECADILKIMNDFSHEQTFDVKIPEGECHRDTINRFLQCLEDNINNYPFARNILVFSHGGLMCNLVKYIALEKKYFDNCESLELLYSPETKKLTLAS